MSAEISKAWGKAMRDLRWAIAALSLTVAAAASAQSALTPVNESGQIVLTIENHKFSPAEIHVKSGQKSQILIKNLDATAEEFDSTSLKIEKVIAGRSEGVVRLRGLDAGSYPFVGEYHPDTAKGVVIAE
jgi:plastocyanin